MFIEELLEEPLQGVVLLYGPAASGKTTTCLETLSGRSAYITTNKNFNVERLRTLRSDADEIIGQLVLFEPKTLLDLEKAVQAAVKLSPLTRVIAIDSIATLLRTSQKTEANLALNRMIKMLASVQCPIIITSEVYDYLRESRHEFVGGDILRLSARSIIEFSEGEATIKKHPMHSGRVWRYEITDSGLQKI